MNTCLNCSTIFKPKPGSTGKFCCISCSSEFNSAKSTSKFSKLYYDNPKYCKQCNNVIEYTGRKGNKFCGRSCAGKYNNAIKDWSTIKTGPVKTIKEPKLLYTRIYLCTCKISGIQWYSPTRKSIHPSMISTKKLYSYQCRFLFGINLYPEWFMYAGPLIVNHGWYSASNRGNNLNGCSRDHLYSVSDGFINGVDPAIISHPANCQITLHRENQRKNKKSSITLEDLHNRIMLFTSKYGNTGEI